MEPKDYVDRGVQTHPCPSTLWLTRQPRTTLPTTPDPPSECTPDALHQPSPVAGSNKSNSLENTSLAYSHALPPDSPSPTRPVARRIKDRQLTPYNHPKQHFKKRRILSLPIDSIAEDRTSMDASDSTTLRMVSLPARFAFSPSPGSSPSSEASFPVAQSMNTPELDRSEPPSQLLLRRYADTPHTPSPPSSPESVLIIETENQLPRTFLRHKSLQSDDEGTPIVKLISYRP